MSLSAISSLMAHGVSAHVTLRLPRERDPARPIQVVAIGMGPDADANALKRIAGATGGESYVARDPDDIAEVFIDAMLAR